MFLNLLQGLIPSAPSYDVYINSLKSYPGTDLQIRRVKLYCSQMSLHKSFEMRTLAVQSEEKSEKNASLVLDTIKIPLSSAHLPSRILSTV